MQKEDFLKRNKKFSKEGYTLLSSSVFTEKEGKRVYWATWIDAFFLDEVMETMQQYGLSRAIIKEESMNEPEVTTHAAEGFPKALIGTWEVELQRKGSQGIQRWIIDTEGRLFIQEEGDHIFMRTWVPEIKKGKYRFRSLDGRAYIEGDEESFRIRNEKEKDSVVIERVDTQEVIHKWSIENQKISPEIKFIFNSRKNKLSFLTDSGEVGMAMTKVEQPRGTGQSH